MSKWHELTIELFETESTIFVKDEIDRIVREWLGEKAKEMSSGNVAEEEWYFSRFGLTEKEEVVVEKKWCEHSPWYENYKFCPICGTPRPSEPSKREKLALLLYSKGTEPGELYWHEAQKDVKDYWFALADAVIEEMEK